MSYPLVKIVNSTPYAVDGKVVYCSAFCSDDDYQIDSFSSWEAESRGVCLVKKVSASISKDGKHFQAKEYTSSGTSYSQFAIIQLGEEEFAVTRIVNGADDLPPTDYVEPTEKQK